jgi:hypothetical protein
MYKKNSILDRPRRPPSARNVESAPIEHERALDKQARLSARYRNYAELDGYASRNAWSDPARLSSTKYDTLHGLQTVVGAKGLETAFRADVDFRSGVAKVPAPWDRAENYPEDDPLADQAWPASPGRGVSPSSPYRPASPGTRSPRLLRDHQIVVPEDDPNDLATQRKHVPPPSRLDGVYDPINHRWVVMPSDASVLDREAMPPGLRSKGNMYHP